MRALYTFILYLLLPWYSYHRYRKAKGTPGAKPRLGEYFGHYPLPPQQKTLWLHAVSLGESITATPLIKQLLRVYPTLPLVVTNTTPSGSLYIEKTFGREVINVFLPVDIPFFLRRFLQYFNPVLGVIIETELWPNLLAVCASRQVPLMLANARLSEKSFAGYRRIKNTSKRMLSAFSKVAAQSPNDGERFVSLGLPSDRLEIAGSLKFELNDAEAVLPQAEALRLKWGKDRLVWVVGSTHKGEDELILQAFANVKRALPNALLVLVPRHSERFESVAALCLQQGFVIARVSENQFITPDVDIVIGDVMRQLLKLYAAGDVAFVGGSLVPVGGHNLLEPAVFAKPVLTGPHLRNFASIKGLLLANNSLTIVHNSTELAQTVITLFQHPDQLRQLGENAKKTALANRGALKRHLAIIESLVNALPKADTAAAN